MIENNGYLDGRAVVVGKDRLADGGCVDTVIHEVAHFTEGSAEYKAYAEHIIEQVSDERITEIAGLNSHYSKEQRSRCGHRGTLGTLAEQSLFFECARVKTLEVKL